MASMASVPAKILVLIFIYLQCFADLTSIAGVCKDWRNAVRVPTSTWNKQILEHPIHLRTNIRLISYKSACEVSLLCSLFLKSNRAFLVPRLRWTSPILSIQMFRSSPQTHRTGLAGMCRTHLDSSIRTIFSIGPDLIRMFKKPRS
jgi:hypothetical protein